MFGFDPLRPQGAAPVWERRDFLKAAVVDAIESKGWDVDYYLTCVYERNRTEHELKSCSATTLSPARYF